MKWNPISSQWIKIMKLQRLLGTNCHRYVINGSRVRHRRHLIGPRSDDTMRNRLIVNNWYSLNWMCFYLLFFLLGCCADAIPLGSRQCLAMITRTLWPQSNTHHRPLLITCVINTLRWNHRFYSTNWYIVAEGFLRLHWNLYWLTLTIIAHLKQSVTINITDILPRTQRDTSLLDGGRAATGG